MIKHRTLTFELGLNNEDICDERLDACLKHGWKIVSYLPNVVDDSGIAGEPGSVYTEVVVVLAKEEGCDAKGQERHNRHMSDFMALLKMNDLAKCCQLSRLCDVDDDDENEVKTQEEHSQYIKDCKELVAMAESIVAKHGWRMSDALRCCVEVYTGVKGEKSDA